MGLKSFLHRECASWTDLNWLLQFFTAEVTMKVRVFAAILITIAVLAGGRYAWAQHGAYSGKPLLPASISSAALVRAGLPSQETAKAALSAALGGLRHPQWIDIPVGTTTIRSFVVFPV